MKTIQNFGIVSIIITFIIIPFKYHCDMELDQGTVSITRGLICNVVATTHGTLNISKPFCSLNIFQVPEQKA